VIHGKGTQESEFVLGDQGADGNTTHSSPVEKPAKPAGENQETSALPVKEEENPMQLLLNRIFNGS